MEVPSSSRSLYQPQQPQRLSSPLRQHLRLRWFRGPSAHSSVALSIDLMRLPSSSLIGTLEEFSLLWLHKGIISEDLAKSRPCDWSPNDSSKVALRSAFLIITLVISV